MDYEKTKGSKGKEKVIDSSIKVVRSYATKGSEKKMWVDALKVSKYSTTKKKRLKKMVVVEKENVEVMEVREDESIDLDIAARKKDKKFISQEGQGPHFQILVTL